MSDKFLKKIESVIGEMNNELAKVRKSRLKPKYHVAFVNDKLNSIIKSQANKNPDDPVRSLGFALSMVGETIQKSFENIDDVEKNIIVTINAYNNIKDLFISCENEEKQLNTAHVLETAPTKDKVTKARVIGEKPVNKISKRKISTKKSKKLKTKHKAKEKNEE